MLVVSKLSYSKLSELTLGKTVRFVSDCEFFPNFDVTGKVIDLSLSGSEYIFTVKTKGKKISIGSNMKNLRIEIK